MVTTATAASSSAGTLDVPSLVSQLMALERQPIDKLNAKITANDTKISSFGTISGLVSGLQTAVQNLSKSLNGFATTTSDSTVFSSSASSTAVAGSYALNVTSLAQSQSLVSTGVASSSSAISDGTSTTLSFDFGTTTGASFVTNGSGVKSITIDGTNNSMQGIAAAINAANIGVTATIINDGSASAPYRLSITSSSSGESNSLKISTSGGDGTIDALLAYDPAGAKNLTQTVAAQNANFTLNGIAITSASNTVASAIQGVSITLNQTTTSPATLTVAHDSTAVSTAATSFVDSYNALYNQMKSRSAYGTSALAGDGTVRLMMTQLRSVFMTGATGGTMSLLSQAGINSQADGTLKLDSAALTSALSTNYSDVSNLFTSTSGFGTRLDAWATSVLSVGTGLIATRTSSIQASTDGYNTRISQLENRMTTLQKQYTTQYSNLNMLLSSMNNTSSYLTVQLAKL
ncbi:MAG: flagellar filament capping protein FliD [Gallionella sp.]|nr:flagellar filament capping protein FliD [Gallionella sp.]